MTNKKLIDLESLNKFAKDFNNEIDKKFNAELEIKADKSELFSKDYNDLTNKPFYETSELKLFTNDGDNTGRLIVNNGTTNIKFAKISEDEIDSSSIDQARFSMFVGDEGYEISDPSTFVIVENETGSAINLGEYVVCTFNDNFAMDMSGTIVTFPEKGLYFSFNASGSHAWRLDNVYLPVASVKQLDEKFIPDTIARTDNIPEGFSGDYNDLKNKPSIPSIEGLATENYVDEKLEDINLTSYIKTVNGVTPNEDGNVTVPAVSVGPDEPMDNSSIWIDTDSEEIELATIDDTSIRNDSTWSSSKIHNELSNIKINANIQNLSSTPDYVVTEAQNIADKVIKTRNAYSIVIGSMSDLHTTGSDSSAPGVLHAFQGINEIDKFTPIDLVSIHGDVMVGYMTDEYQSGFKYVRSCMNEITKNVPLIQMQGNHDDLSSDTTEVARQRYFSYIGANNEGTVTDFANRFRNYGYKDFDDLRIRFIYLNSADASESERTSSEWITPMQFDWFVNTALDFSNKQGSEDWQWIVACHHPLNTGGVTQYLLNMLKAYTAKTSGSFDLYHLDKKYTISYDFTNVKQRFICHLHGHIHNFRTEWFDDVLSITVPNACYGRNNEYGTHSSYSDEIRELLGDIDENGQQRQFNKTSNSAYDTAFITFVIDSRVNNKIYAYCYGAGIDREIDLTTKEIKYIDKPIEDIPDIPAEPGDTYTNLIPTSIDTDGTIFNGVGYKTGYRISSSGVISESDMCITGFIDVEANQTIRLKNVTINGGEPPYIVWYNQDKSFKVVNAIETVWEYDSENDLYVGNSDSNDGWLRISCGVIDSTSILTINEDIPNDDGGDTPVEPSEPINLLVISDRIYETFSTDTDNFREVTVPHELTTDKYYPSMYDGRIGKYCASKITVTPNTEVNGFTFKISSSTGYGLLFPLSITSEGKYWIKLACTGTPVVVEVVQYDSNKLYVGRTRLSGGLSGDGVAYQVAFDVTDTSASYAVYFNIGATYINKDCVITNLNVWKA